MPQIVFWNTQRLGASTDAVRARALRTVAGHWKPDLFLTCELTTASTVPTAQNLTYRAENARQLCYGAQNATPADVKLTHVTPNAVQDYVNCGYKGGNDFTRLADRAVGQSAAVAAIGAVDVYVIHAPAGRSSATKAMAFLASSLQAHYAGTATQWIVVGDFNVEPAALAATAIPNIAGMIKNSGNPTHYYKRTKRYSELDYALTNIAGLKVRTLRYNIWRLISDHGPILLEF